MSLSYEEMEEKWGSRAARGFRGAGRGRMVEGRTGRQLEEDDPSEVDEFFKKLAQSREEQERSRSVSVGSSRASLRRKKQKATEEAKGTTGEKEEDVVFLPTTTPTTSTTPLRKTAPFAEKEEEEQRTTSFLSQETTLASPKTKKKKKRYSGGESSDVFEEEKLLEDESKKKKKKKSPPPSDISSKKKSLFATSPTTTLGVGKKDDFGALRDAGDGLWIREVRLGQGDMAISGNSASVLYTGKIGSKRFDHCSNPNAPFEFVLGEKQVLDGFDRGVQGMRTGGIRDVVVPPHLAYGTAGAPPKIPANATLNFQIQLVDTTEKHNKTIDFASTSNDDNQHRRRRPRGTRGGARVNKRRIAAANANDVANFVLS